MNFGCSTFDPAPLMFPCVTTHCNSHQNKKYEQNARNMMQWCTLTAIPVRKHAQTESAVRLTKHLLLVPFMQCDDDVISDILH